LGVIGENFEPEPFALCSIEQPQLIESLLNVFATRIYRTIEAMLEAGARPLFIIGGPEFATPPLLPPRCFDEYVVRIDRPLIDLIHRYGCKVVVHCHGRLNAVLDRFIDMGVDGLHPLEAPPMGDVTPADAKRRVGDRLCILGNLQIGDMMTRPPHEIKQQVRQLRQQIGNGLIVTTSATPYEVPMSQRLLENYQAALDALDE
jgi:uroporphyrinogen-III decarboxylase